VGTKVNGDRHCYEYLRLWSERSLNGISQCDCHLLKNTTKAIALATYAYVCGRSDRLMDFSQCDRFATNASVGCRSDRLMDFSQCDRFATNASVGCRSDRLMDFLGAIALAIIPNP
jgi:hypothetical protein